MRQPEYHLMERSVGSYLIMYGSRAARMLSLSVSMNVEVDRLGKIQAEDAHD